MRRVRENRPGNDETSSYAWAFFLNTRSTSRASADSWGLMLVAPQLGQQAVGQPSCSGQVEQAG